jgi:serine/threonine protein kinase
MRDLVHPNIVQYIGCKVDEAEQVCFIFQQYCSGGSIAHLLEHMQKGKYPTFGFQEQIIKHYTRQILCGLCYLHENHIIHRDIKGGNILLDTSGTVKLADFGCSTLMNSLGETINTKQIAGSPYFMAPEVFTESRYGRRGDVWAVGCTVIQMITGKPPWRDRNVNIVQIGLLVQNWSEGPPPVLDYSRTPHVPKEISKPLRELLRMCFVKDNNNRPFPAEVFIFGGEISVDSDLSCQICRAGSEMRISERSRRYGRQS